MPEIIIKTQAELDALPKAFKGYTVIKIESAPEIWITVREKRESSRVEAWESSRVEAWGSSRVEAWGSSRVEAWGSSRVVARESSHVVARESSHVEAWESSYVEAWESSRVEAWGSSRVVAWESSRVEARGSSYVEAWGSSRVEARGSSRVEAWGSSRVEAWGSSRVEARESSHVVARESSHVEAWESSYVEAWGSSHVVARESSHVVARESSHVEGFGNVSVSVQSKNTVVLLFSFAVAILVRKCKNVVKKSKTATVINVEKPRTNKQWLEEQGIKPEQSVILFKRVSSEFKTQEGEPHETHWEIGTTLTHPDWNPKEKECGEGKFHACSRPCFCDEFRSTAGDKYIAISVAKADLYAWPNAQYPHKIAFRKGKVLHECDRYGKKV